MYRLNHFAVLTFTFNSLLKLILHVFANFINRAHKRLHDPNQKGYTCDLCGKVMLFKATLDAHMKSVHSDVKDYVCQVAKCNKRFKTPGQLRVSVIIHKTVKALADKEFHSFCLTE